MIAPIVMLLCSQVAAILSPLLTSCRPPSGLLPSAPPGPGCSSSGCAFQCCSWEERPVDTRRSHSALLGHTCRAAPRSSLPAGAVLAGLSDHQVSPRTRHPPQPASTGTWPCSCPACPPVGPSGNGTVLPLAPASQSQRNPHDFDEDNPSHVQVPRGHTLDRTLCGWLGGPPAALPSPRPCNDRGTFSPFQTAAQAAKTP